MGELWGEVDYSNVDMIIRYKNAMDRYFVYH